MRLLLPLLAFSVILASSFAQETPAAAIVKLATPLQMDGDTAAWAAIQPEQSIDGRLGPVASFKAAYDDENFYALFQVRDTSPLKNGSTIPREILKGGDTLGLCFGPGESGGAQRILFGQAAGKDVVAALRPQWKIKKPYTYYTAAAGSVPMDFADTIEGEGVETHFETIKDGYLAEIKIPWTVLGIKPSAGLAFPFDAQVIFSDPAGTTNLDTAWWHSRGSGPQCTTDLSTEARLYPAAWGKARLFEKDPGPTLKTATKESDPAFIARGLPITFTLPNDAHVSLTISNEKGWIVRELLRANPMLAGSHTVYWDGRDRYGYLLPAGVYNYRIGYFDGLKATFAGSAGNSANPPYRTADGLGSAGGMHAGPRALATATDGAFMYLLNGGEEGNPAMRKIDAATGKALWFHTVGGFGSGDAVAADENYVYLINTANKSTNLVRIDPKTGHDVADDWASSPLPLGELEVASMAVMNGTAYYSVPAENRIGTVDLTNGEKGSDLPIPAPKGLFPAGKNALYVCTGTEVVRLDLTSGKRTSVIKGLEAPAAVTVDSAGNFYVSDLGKTQQIKKYSPTGKLIATIGTPGGREVEAMPYDPMAFRNVTSLAIGPDGNLWMVEQNEVPRRYAVLTTDGKFVRDIFGPSRCADAVGFDLDDFTSVYHYGSWSKEGQFINSIIDYDAYAKSPDPQKGVKVASIVRLSQTNGGLDPAKDIIAETAGSEHAKLTVFTANNGKRYLAIFTGRCIVLFLWENNRWIASAIVGGDTMPTYWSDTNGDGIIQPEEASTVRAEIFWGAIDKDLTIYNPQGSIKPASVDTRGVPSYFGGEFTPTLSSVYPSIDNLTDLTMCSYGVFMDRATSDDSIYMACNVGPGQYKDFWDRTSEHRLIKFKDGQAQWMVGHHDATLAHNGDGLMTFGVSGETDGVILTADVGGNFIAYTSDGLSLGWVLTDENGRPAMVGPNAIYLENAAAGVFRKDPKTGKHLLIVHSCEDIRVLEISGVFGDDIHRIEGQVTLTKSEDRAIEATANHAIIPALTWKKSIYEIWRGTNIDGVDYEWTAENPSVPILDGKERFGEIRLRRDAGNLCVFADVLDAAPFSGNVTAEDGSLFTQTEGVELLLGPLNPQGRTNAGPGDTRIFLTATRDKDGQLKGHAFACKPASEPIPPSEELSVQDAVGVFRDKGTTEPLDLRSTLTPIPGASIKVRDRFDGKGYTLEAEIPIAILPEISKLTQVSYCRTDNGQPVFKNALRSDLSPALFNTALWRKDAKGVPTRYPWRKDGFVGNDPAKMNPSAWGVESDPISVLLGVSPAAPFTGIRHEKTTSSAFTFGTNPIITVESAIFGGGWFFDKDLKFLTTAASPGFEITPGPGIESINNGGRVARVDMTRVGVQNLSAQAQRAANPGDAVTATIKTNFAPGQTGTLHVLWGSFTDNTGGGAALSITDAATKQSVDPLSVPELTFDLGFNAQFDVHESTFTIGGNGPFNLTLNDTQDPQRAVLSAIWIEPTVQDSFTVGTPISVAAYFGATAGPVQVVEFFANDKKIGEAKRPPYAIVWKPAKSGTYALSARVTDTLGVTGSSALSEIQINSKE